MAGRIAYYGNTVNDGLVLYLDAAKKESYPGFGTSWTDLSGQRIVGTLTNGPTFSSDNGGSIIFDGVDDFVTNVGTVSSFSFIQNTGVYTISAWARINTLGSFALMGNNGTGTGNRGFFINCANSNGLMSLQVTYGTGGQYTLVNTVLNYWLANTWTYLTCTGDGSIGRVYRNGQPIGSTANFGVFSTGDSTATLGIGRANNLASAYWPGNISQVSIYNRTLSAAEILQNYNATRGRFGL